MSSIFGIGCDIVKVSRIEKLMKSEDALKRVFHTSELQRFEAEHLAGIFAAKEAAIKALGLSADSWLELEVSSEKSGKPAIAYTSFNFEKMEMAVSISHEKEYAAATVLVMNRD